MRKPLSEDDKTSLLAYVTTGRAVMNFSNEPFSFNQISSPGFMMESNKTESEEDMGGN